MEVKPGLIYESKEDDISITGSKMSFSINKKIPLTDENVPMDSAPKKKGRKSITIADGKINRDGVDSDLPEIMTNTPYHESYAETNNMLKSVIYQSDMMSNDINKDLSDIRASRTLKKKYDYISLLSSTSSTLLSTKVTAIRELNKSITDSHNLELKRTKDLKLTMNEQDDDKKIMDMYNAFISTPVGVNSGFIPPAMDLNYASMNGGVELGSGSFDSYVNNMTPEQNRMRAEHNPNIKTVVKYFSDTGARCFDVIDITTGASVDNISKPDAMFLDNITIDVRNNIARDTNLDITYPLVVIGNSSISEY